jgi:hypothetical protein
MNLSVLRQLMLRASYFFVVLISLFDSLAGSEMYGDGFRTDCDMNHCGWLRQCVVQCIFGNDTRRFGLFPFTLEGFGKDTRDYIESWISLKV